MIPSNLISAFKHTLTSGGYNLLLGSGISLDSHNGTGAKLAGATALKAELCKLKGVGDSVQLHRVVGLLTDLERSKHLVVPYSNCVAGDSLSPLSSFLWRRAFTFNIDDVLENLYDTAGRRQQDIVPLNFNAAFEPTPNHDELLAIHLHGWVREPDAGFVFSYPEYARVMKGQNPWMHLLAQILATEAFIIVGTSLNEIDLEYYLSFRNASTPRRGGGPSLYIEPDPDAVTEADCKRYGLTLIKATFGDFLAWLQREIPNPPTLAQLLIPDTGKLFGKLVPQKSLMRFFADFRPVMGGERPRSTTPSPFLYGEGPQLDDLQQHLDISRVDNLLIQNEVEEMLGRPNDKAKVLLILEEPGTGKTTLARRVAHDLVSKGQPVLALKAVAKIDSQLASECLRNLTSKVVLVVDGFADHADQLVDILQDPDVRQKVIVLGAERTYREYLIASLTSDSLLRTRGLQKFDTAERLQLLELYRQFGLVAESAAIANPTQYANLLSGEPVAVAICRILNDFKPLDAISDSLWKAATEDQRLAYLSVALAEFCHPPGLQYNVVREIVGQHTALDAMFTKSVPLGLADNQDEADYVLTLNATIGDRVLRRASDREGQFMLRTFLAVAGGIAPQVNRKAIMARTPEARLAGRLFDSDKVVKPLLKKHAEAFYLSAQSAWEWNSRYWEQRALMVADSDLDAAVAHARHAVAIERHSYPLTTLGKLLMRQSELNPLNAAASFDEGFEKLKEAIEHAHSKSRVTIHPFHAMFSGVRRYVDKGGKLTAKQQSERRGYVGEAQYHFGTVPMVSGAIDRIQGLF